MRLNKFIAESGFASRRKADELISQGRVTVNDETVVNLGVVIDPEKDTVKVDGSKIKTKTKVYFLLNKPAGIVSTTNDEKGRTAVTDLIKTKFKIYPVGRLDYNTTGVLLLTNDGDFTNMMLHPSNKIEREYLVTLDKDLREEDRLILTKHVQLEGKNSRFNSIKYIKEKNYRIMRVITVEGRNHFVKNMFSLLGYTVKKLKRIRFGPFTVDDITEGKYMILNKSDIEKFIKSINKKK
jgi:23S rRNA pseudouridine2605 synthase